MANFVQYDYEHMSEIWASHAAAGKLQNTNFYPTIGQCWLVWTVPNDKLRYTSKVVTFDPESGVVVTENSVYVRG